MRFLFISNYFPGDLLAADPRHEVLFASNRQRKDYNIPHVRRVHLKKYAALFGGERLTAARLWEEALKRGESGLHTLHSLRQSWGRPDVVFASAANGAAFFAPRAFPDSFHVAYAETGLKNIALLPADIRQAWMLLQSTLFLQSELCFVFSESQKKQFPEKLRPSIRVVPTGVETDVFSPEAARPLPGYNGAGGELVTLDALGLGGTKLGGLCHLCRELLSERPQCRIVMLVENACLRQELETAAAVWPGACRFAACNSLPFETYRDLLAASSLVICPRGEEADIRPMLECMSCETLLMAPAAAGTVLRPGITMLDFPGEASENRKKAVTHALDHLAELAPIARNGRRAVLEHSDRDRILPDHLKLILEAYGKQGL